MVTEHYGAVADPAAAILAALGHPAELTLDALAPVDEFHLGGPAATVALGADLGITAGDRVLDIGCGIGGPARRLAATRGCHVLGLDLTPSFVATATRLTELTGLTDRVRFRVADAAEFEVEGRFDAAMLVHVGMNVPDKAALFAAVAGLLGPGGRFGIYDVMVVAPLADLAYPLPFAATADHAALSTPPGYTDALTAAGFTIESVVDRRPLVRQVLTSAADAPPPAAGLGTLMGDEWPAMFANLRAAVRDGVLAPYQIIATC